ncbi:hypothetical protein phiPLPE_20 [Iodobacter phage PhiPLPE]|uniref:Uncharacterized protein n=1 Tax=Iodobacter phage PhiPLPE TaxID=551895 RepID=B5AX39_9CAUD|nr:hypothetical protein phiPLPE_20 [Iodobacter phage PhiPLPE]ACG60342.1 hypothetical protein phiPLPE_20 [Iodobacter phage PhiPLPE]
MKEEKPDLIDRFSPFRCYSSITNEYYAFFFPQTALRFADISMKEAKNFFENGSYQW